MSLGRNSRVAVAAAAATLTGALTFVATGESSDPTSALTDAVSVESVPGPSVRPPSRPSTSIRVRSAAPTASAVRVGSAPTRVRIPSLGATLPVRPMGLDSEGAMALPASPSRAGWYRFGAAPGGGRGATVIAAHVDAPREGPGPLADLERLRSGDAIEVTAGSATLTYRVTRVVRIDKGELDLDAVFARSGPERLHVVSCGGRFNPATRHYEDNVIAIAVPVTSP